MAKRIPTPADIFRFYVDGFRSMTLGRTLWAIILLKLFIMFAILRLFFFPDQLAGMSQEQPVVDRRHGELGPRPIDGL